MIPLNPRHLTQSRLTFALLHLARIYRRLVDRRLLDHRISDARALPVLHIARAGSAMRQGALAEAMGIEGPSLVRLLDQLGSAGLVERHPDPSDGRAKTLHVTDEGRALASEVEDVLHILRDELFAGICEEDIAATLRVFAALDAAIKRNVKSDGAGA
jgi:MarR family transcriptional regulator for hemolysin